MKTGREYKAVVIGGSAGSFSVMSRILNSLDPGFNIPVFMSLHRLKYVRMGFMEALSAKSNILVVEPNDKDKIKPGIAYLAPSNYHFYLELGYTIALSTDETVNHSRPAIDLSFETASTVYGKKLIGILLSGANKDGAKGMRKIKENGGITIIQDPDECKIDTMPKAALKEARIDYIYKTEKIIEFLNSLNKS